MDEHKDLRTMIEEGKDKLEWYRQVDPAKLNTLKELINAPNYKENMATLIRSAPYWFTQNDLFFSHWR
jgi:hypothetical protein